MKRRALTAMVFLLAIALALFSLSETSRANPDPTDDFAEALGLAPGEFLTWSLGTSDAAGAAIFSAGDFPSPGSSVSPFPFPTEGETFVVLSSGTAADANTANLTGNLTTVLGGLNTNEGNDLVQLALALPVPPSAESFAFDFMFCSDEWPEYYGSEYNDAFLAEVAASTFVVNGDGTITAPNNIATDPDGNQVTVNVGYGFDPGDPNPDTGTTYDGCTSVISTQVSLVAAGGFTPSAVVKGTLLVVYFSVFDVGDSFIDSAVFLDNFRFLDEAGEGFEICDGEDNDGDTLVDEGFPDGDGDTIADCVDLDTSTPTQTPADTDTPTPTATGTATPTATAIPTSTATATSTSEATPTSASEPHRRSTPTETPVPTATTAPTAQPPQAPTAAPPAPPAPLAGEAGTSESPFFGAPATGSGGQASGRDGSRPSGARLPPLDAPWVYPIAAAVGLLGSVLVVGGLRIRHRNRPHS